MNDLIGLLVIVLLIVAALAFPDPMARLCFRRVWFSWWSDKGEGSYKIEFRGCWVLGALGRACITISKQTVLVDYNYLKELPLWRWKQVRDHELRHAHQAASLGWKWLFCYIGAAIREGARNNRYEKDAREAAGEK